MRQWQSILIEDAKVKKRKRMVVTDKMKWQTFWYGGVVGSCWWQLLLAAVCLDVKHNTLAVWVCD